MKDPVAVPASVLDFCQKAAARWHLDLQSLADQKKIAQNILKLSDFFIDSPEDPTPWHEIWAQQAYVFYFLPLNSIRLSRVFSHLDLTKVPFAQVYDFGAGLATASRFLLNQGYKLNLIEHAREPQELVQACDVNNEAYHWRKDPPSRTEVEGLSALSCFSYSLTELQALPEWAWASRGLLLVEPSTQQDGRRLMQWREQLIARGYRVQAPCTHQGACPLLHQSKTDWCHDRVHAKLPEWMLQAESYLPMKNRTLTMSYLFATTTTAAIPKTSPANSARVTGDLLKEKGKDRQLICRGPEREFLAWMHKHGAHEEIPRGEIIHLPETLQKVSNELRVPAGSPSLLSKS